jgi:hypothetical protein
MLRPLRGQRGLTLVKLMVVVAITLLLQWVEIDCDAMAQCLSVRRANDRVDFDLDQHVRVDQALYFNQRAGRDCRSEGFRNLIDDRGPVCDVREVNPVANDIVRRCTGLPERPEDVRQYLAGLCARIADADERPILPSPSCRKRKQSLPPEPRGSSGT